MKITDVRVLHVRGPAYERSASYRQHRALHHYDEYASTSEWESGADHPTVSTSYVRIEAGEHFGLYGPVDGPAADLIRSELREFVIGKDPRQFSILWDQMYRRDRHARSSHPMMALSAIDNAVWDLLGRYYDAPVCQLLGGPRASKVDAYASTLGTSLAPGDAEETAKRLVEQGLRHQKWFFGYGPIDGSDGLAANVDLARRLRDAVGEDVELSFDAFMSWTVPYAREWLRRAAPYRPYWLEEPLPADQLEAMATLRRDSAIPITAGEHLYGRWEVFRYLEAGAIDVVQSDPEWCGGVTELVQICTVASLYGVPVIPHGHGIRSALHVVASQPPSVCPKIEYLVEKVRHKLHFEVNPPVPIDGKVEVGTAPGFGIELDDDKIDRIETS